MSDAVLVVEDEDIIRRGIICSVDWYSLGCGPISEAQNGQEALELIQTGEFDIVIMDINIPIIGGLEVLEQTYDKFGYVPILLTGYSDFNFARRALGCGAVEYLLKPVDIDELVKSIRKAKAERDRRRTYDHYQKGELSFQGTVPNLIDTGTSHGEISDVVKKMLDYVEKNFSQKITLADMSQKLFYSETFMIRSFKKDMGINFSEYLNRYRIQCAINMLRTTDMRVTDICAACGFNSYKYFNMVFKKLVGCSAQNFMKKINGK